MSKSENINRLVSPLVNRLVPKTLSPEATKILTLLDSGHLTKAVSVLFSSPFSFPVTIYTRLFQYCSSKLAIVEARKIETHLSTFWPTPPPPTFLLNRAIETYGKCGRLDNAKRLFDEMSERDGGSWNAMITAYSQGGCPDKALLLFSRMNKLGVSANKITFASVLGSCAAVLALFLSRQVHGLVIKFGLCDNVILGSSLVDVYGKCRLIHDSRRMFDELHNPNAVSWNVIVRRYLEHGHETESVVMFFKMIGTSVTPINFTFSNALVACSRLLALEEGRQIHGIALKIGYLKDQVVIDSLIDMYAKCGVLEDAHQLFNQLNFKDVISWTTIVSGYAICGRIREARMLFNDMPQRSVISWNAMLAGYVRVLEWEEALDFIFWMLKSTQDIDYVTLGLVLNVCAGLLDVERGKQAHAFIYRHNLCLNVLVGNALLDMYGKCGSFASSNSLFHEMSRWRDDVSWNALINNYARHGHTGKAKEKYIDMLREATPSEFTFSTLLAIVGNIFAIEQGKQIHGYMLRNGYNFDVVVRATLVTMYCKCRCLEYAVKVFKEETSKDLVLCNSMIMGCAFNGKGLEVLELFELMKEEGIKADNITFHAVLLACIGEGFVELGKQYFNSMSECYSVIPRPEHYDCMIELFCRYGFMNELEDFVLKMPFQPHPSMLVRIFDSCRDHKFPELGEWAAEQLNKLNPLTPFRFYLFK